jgi:hypothetical protein
MFLTTIALIGLQFNPTDTIEPKKEVLGEVRVTTTVRKETVTGVIQSMRLSPVVMDGISQETIKRSPDRNLGETLKRVGGTTIQNDRFVTVRGLSDRYNTVMINGAMFTSTEPDRRAFSFDIIPTNVVDNMTISKTFCANLPGDFAGGAIQINTKSDFTEKTNNITLGFGYGSLSTFNQGRYVNFTNLPSSFPTTKEFRISELNQRKEFTNLLPIQYNPVTKTNLPNLNLNYSYINKWRWGNKGLGIVTNFSYRNSNSIQYNERKDYQSPNELAYVYNDVVYTNTSNISWLFNPTYIKNKSKFTFKNLLNYQDENTFMVRNGENYDNLQSLNYTNTIGYKKFIYTTQFEGSKKLDDGVKNYGVNFYTLYRTQPDYRINPKSKSLGSEDSMITVWRDTYRFWSKMNESGLGGHYNVTKDKLSYGMMDQVKYRTFNSRVFRYTNSELLNEITNNTDKYNGMSNLLSTYVQYKNNYKKLKYIVGVRNENQHFMVNTSDFSGRDILVTKSYYDLLPTINTNYTLSEKNSLRLSASRTIARPEFREVSNFAFYDFVRNAQIIGNPNLKKSNITNMDFRFERYMSNKENLYVSGFFKHFQNPIEQIVANGSVPSNLILTYSNPKDALTYGVELEYRKNITKHFTYYTNLSLIKSTVTVNGHERPLQGQSPYIINTGLYYQKENLSVSLLYNRIGERITAVGFNGYSDIYENSRDLVDATVQYRTKRLEFKLSVTDMLSQPTILYQKTNGDLIKTINEKTISISLNYKL